MEKKNTGLVWIVTIFVFFMCFTTTGYVSVFGFLPDYVGTDLVTASLGPSVFGVVGMIAGLVAAKIFRTIGAKNAMLLSAILMIVYGVCMGLFPSVPVLLIMFGISGLVNAIGIVTAAGDILVQEFGLDSAKHMTTVVGGALLGCGVGQGLTGIAYANFGMKAVFLGVIASAAVISAILTFFIKVSPVTAAAGAAAAAAGEVKRSSIFANPKAWIFWILTALAGGLTMPILSYATVYFPNFGQLSISATATVVSLLGICSGLYNLFLNGRVLQKLGVKASCTIIFICMALVSAFAVLYGNIPAIWVIALMIISYAVGATSANLHAIVSPLIFGTADSTEAMTKASSFQGLGLIIYPVVFANIITGSGIPTAFMVAVVISIVCAAGYLVLFAMSAKKAAAHPEESLEGV